MKKIIYNLKKKLAKTKYNFIGKLAEAIKLRGKVDEELMEDLEDILLQSDIGADLSLDIIEDLREKIRVNKITKPEEVKDALEDIIKKILAEDYSEENLKTIFEIEKKPLIILFVGVNGVGKTTTIGKIAKKFKSMKKKVLLVAADTFRAAAIEQLEIWSKRAKCPIMKQKQGSDPSSVVYDGVRSAVTKNFDVVLIDTAGRLHNKKNLMLELTKMKKTIKKIVPDGPHETLLVVDATTGQNAITQAKIFQEASEVNGIVLTKLDGTAKGGIVIGIKHRLNIPVKFIGVGEKIEDLQPFKIEEFVEALFE